MSRLEQFHNVVSPTEDREFMGLVGTVKSRLNVVITWMNVNFMLYGTFSCGTKKIRID